MKLIENNSSYLILYDFFRTRGRLSNAEARLVVSLFNSINLSEAANKLGIRYETARKHLKNVSKKIEGVLRDHDVPPVFCNTRWLDAIMMRNDSTFRQDYLMQLCERVLISAWVQKFADKFAGGFESLFRDLGSGNIEVLEQAENVAFSVFHCNTGISPVRKRQCREEELLPCMKRYLFSRGVFSFKVEGDMDCKVVLGTNETEGLDKAAEAILSVVGPTRVVTINTIKGNKWVPQLRIHFIPTESQR